MSSPASFKGHPFHPIIIPLPIGLWIFSIVSDFIFKFGWGGEVWNDVAFYTLAGGIIGALIAALPGFIDLTGLQNPKTKSIAIYWPLACTASISGCAFTALRATIFPLYFPPSALG